eukprot:408371-Pelagomonas_calceolata.AAC.2
MVHACPNNCLAVLSLAAAVYVSSGLPICNFELEVPIGLTRSRGSMGRWARGGGYMEKESPGMADNLPDPH